MNTEQLRADFEAWAASIGFCVTGKYAETIDVLCAKSAFKAGYQAGRAALQSQKPEPNNLMLSAVIRIPFEMAMADPISRMQFYQRAQQALNELEALQHSCKETSQDKEDAERYRWLRKHWFTMTSCYDGGRVEFTTGQPRYSSATEANVDEAIDHARRVEDCGNKG